MKSIGYKIICICSLICSACTESTHNYNYIVEKNDHSFPIEELRETGSTDKEYSFQIEEWTILNEKLYCNTSLSDRLFYSISLNDYQVLDSFGIKGHGRNEFVAPHLFKIDDSKLGIYDNGKKENYIFSGNRIRKSESWNLDLAVNDLKTIKYPMVAYVLYEPDIIRFQIINAENNEICDSIIYKDDGNQGKSIQYDFVWDSYKSYIVLAHRYSDVIKICRINDSGIITDIKALDNGEGGSSEKIYNTSVACGKYIYVLNQSNVNVDTQDGFSTVELYDYTGKHIKKLCLDIIADRMLLDTKHNKLLFLSPMDSYLHFTHLSDKE